MTIDLDGLEAGLLPFKDKATGSIRIGVDEVRTILTTIAAARERDGLRADDCSRFVFVEALAKETFADKYGPSAWAAANDVLRREWINRTQDAVQRARQSLAPNAGEPK